MTSFTLENLNAGSDHLVRLRSVCGGQNSAWDTLEVHTAGCDSVTTLTLTLRDRKGDIVPLFMKFATDFSFTYHFPPVELTPDAMEKLKAYAWPGNIRQLKHVTEQIIGKYLGIL